MRQVLLRDVRRAALIDGRASTSVRSMAHWTPSGPRDSSKARRYNEKRAADAAAASSSASSSSSPYAVSDELRASRSAPVEPDAEGRLPLFRGGGVRAPPGTVEPATTLSSFYPAVALPPILARPLVKPGRPRSLGEFKTKAVKPRGRIEGARVDAQAYADRLPPHASALYTVAVRAGLADPARPARKMKNAAEGGDVAGGGAPSVERPVADALELADAVLQAITHPSFFESDAASAANARPAPSSPSDPAPLAPAEQRDNALLAASGRAVLELVLTEYHLKQFPNMPTPGLKRIVTALSNAGALADVGAEIGLGLVQKSPDHGQTDLVATGLPVRYRRHTWERPASADDPALELEAISSAVRAIIGLLYAREGLPAATRFIHGHFLSRAVDLSALLRHEQPLAVLRAAVVRFGLEPPVPRILAESGRLSATPFFNVACYSGELKLGEGAGTSLQMAQFRAATNSLHGLYLAQSPAAVLSLGAFARHPLSDAPNWALERKYQEVAPAVGEVEPVQFSADRPQRAVAVGGYTFEPLADAGEAKAAFFRSTVKRPATVDSGRLTSAERFARSGKANHRDAPAPPVGV